MRLHAISQYSKHSTCTCSGVAYNLTGTHVIQHVACSMVMAWTCSNQGSVSDGTEKHLHRLCCLHTQGIASIHAAMCVALACALVLCMPHARANTARLQGDSISAHRRHAMSLTCGFHSTDAHVPLMCACTICASHPAAPCSASAQCLRQGMRDRDRRLRTPHPDLR